MTETTADDEAVAVTSTTVAADPHTAFEVFTGGIARWWRRGTHYWNDPGRGLRVEFEPGVGGRFLEVYDDGAFEIGRVTAWEPGERLGFTWREATWDATAATTVDVRFEAVDGGTRVTVRHGGWDAAGQRDSAGNYSHGWVELLGWFGEAAAAGARA
jgi:uncharacterized protein YndB with AHSA1/START domain